VNIFLPSDSTGRAGGEGDRCTTPHNSRPSHQAEPSALKQRNDKDFIANKNLHNVDKNLSLHNILEIYEK
jgi:hypothetical protein